MDRVLGYFDLIDQIKVVIKTTANRAKATQSKTGLSNKSNKPKIIITGSNLTASVKFTPLVIS
jgi:hypothetical protein